MNEYDRAYLCGDRFAMMLSQLPISFKALSSTTAFQTADKAWPFESWDDREWNRVCKNAMKELNDGNSSK